MNDGKPQYVIEKVVKAAAKFKHPVIACLGLAFKADIDDLRESPAVEIVERLVEMGVGDILVVEPNVEALPDSIMDKVRFTSTKNAIVAADVVLLLVDHKEFRTIPKERLHGCILIDTRGVIV